jgi:predicted GTPase
MIGDIDENEFKKKIQQREKARQRKTDIIQVLEMYNAVLIDLFQKFIEDQDVDDLVTALDNLRVHVNSTIAIVSKRYSNCAVPRINENFDLY